MLVKLRLLDGEQGLRGRIEQPCGKRNRLGRWTCVGGVAGFAFSTPEMAGRGPLAQTLDGEGSMNTRLS